MPVLSPYEMYQLHVPITCTYCTENYMNLSYVPITSTHYKNLLQEPTTCTNYVYLLYIYLLHEPITSTYYMYLLECTYYIISYCIFLFRVTITEYLLQFTYFPYPQIAINISSGLWLALFISVFYSTRTINYLRL